jgi:hypothetical protein
MGATWGRADEDESTRSSDGLLYRRAYGLACERIDAAKFGAVHTRARLDLALGRTLHEVLGALDILDGATEAEIVRRAVEDAAEGRRPCW